MNFPQSPQRDLPQTSMFNPEQAFLDLKVVRITVGTIGALAALVTFLIAVNTCLAFDLSADGFNFAVAQFKVPIGILTVSIPLLALLAANHRSEQTKRQMYLTTTQIARTDQQINRSDQQIKISQGQNVFSNYFKHLEEFEKRFKIKSSSQDLYLISPQKAHQKFFPEAKKGILTISPRVIANISTHAASFIEACRGFNTGEWAPVAGYVHNRMTELGIKYQLGHGTISGILVSVKNGETFTLINGSVPAALTHFISIFRFLDEVCSFDESYTTPKIIADILNLDTSFFPEHVPGKGFVLFDIDRLITISNENLSIISKLEV